MTAKRKARDSLAVSAANAWLRLVASKSYRDRLNGCVSRGPRGKALPERERPTAAFCGVPAFCMVEVCEGYAVPRCEAHREMPAYQAEARLHSVLVLASPQLVPEALEGKQ